MGPVVQCHLHWRHEGGEQILALLVFEIRYGTFGRPQTERQMIRLSQACWECQHPRLLGMQIVYLEPARGCGRLRQSLSVFVQAEEFMEFPHNCL